MSSQAIYCRLSARLCLVGAVTILVGCSREEGRAAEAKGVGGADQVVSQATLLVASNRAATASLDAGILIKLAPGWHTYADPPGDSGMAPALFLELPEGVTAGALRYPPHSTFEDESGITYGYEGAVLLRFPLTRAHGAAWPSGGLSITGRVDYLVCRDVCLPRSDDLSATLEWTDAPGKRDRTWAEALVRGGWAEE